MYTLTERRWFKVTAVKQQGCPVAITGHNVPAFGDNNPQRL
jgi:hypothetical protein